MTMQKLWMTGKRLMSEDILGFVIKLGLVIYICSQITICSLLLPVSYVLQRKLLLLFFRMNVLCKSCCDFSCFLQIFKIYFM